MARVGPGFLAGVLLAACSGTRGPDATGPATVLTRVDVVRPGGECAAGGRAVRSGLDSNGDRVLEDSEITQTTILCDAPERTLLLRSERDAADERCPSGGTTVMAGLDANGNGTLDDGEVERVTHECYPVTPPAPAVITRKTPELAGSRCPNGGVRVEAGLDRDGDGVLSDPEVVETTIVCAPTPGPSRPVLVRSAAAPRGACPGQGTTLSAGTDGDGDGVLSDAEVVATTTVCSETVPSFAVRTAADLAIVSRATRVRGDLVIGQSDLESISLRLEVVDGSILLESNQKLKQAVVGVQLLGGSIVVRNNPLLSHVDLGPAFGTGLKAVNGSVVLQDDPALESVRGLEDVAVIGGDVAVDRTALGVLPLDHLAYVGGNLSVAHGTGMWQLFDWRFRQPLIVAGAVRLAANPQMQCDLDDLRHVGGALTIADDGCADNLSAWKLERVSGITLSNNSKIWDVFVPSLRRLDGSFVAVGNAGLSLGYGINHIQEVQGDVILARNAAMEVAGLFVDATWVHGTIILEDNRKLRMVHLQSLTSAGALWVARNAALDTIGPYGLHVPKLQRASTVDVQANPVLARLSMPSLAIADVFRVKDNPVLATCDALGVAAQVTRPSGHLVDVAGNAGEAAACP